MPHSFVGKTLRGTASFSIRTAQLEIDKSSKEIRDADIFSCINNNFDLRFISIVCDENTKCSEKKTYQAQLFFNNNTISCMAIVDDNNIEVIAYGKYDLILDGGQLEDKLINAQLFFKKCNKNYKYKLSGVITENDVVNFPNGNTTEIFNTLKVIKSETFRFVRYL
jgi:hypothetical protein